MKSCQESPDLSSTRPNVKAEAKGLLARLVPTPAPYPQIIMFHDNYSKHAVSTYRFS